MTMQGNLTYCPNPFTLEGRRLSAVKAGSTVAEALRGIGAEGCMVVSVNGRMVDLVNDGELVLSDGDIMAVRTVLEGGRRSSNPVQFVLAITLSAVAFWAAPQISTFLGFAEAGIATNVIASGIVGVGGLGLNALFAPTLPKLPSSQASQSSGVYSLDGGRNAARHYSPHALLLGEHRIWPDLGARPYQEYDSSGNEFFTMQFNCGHNIHSLTDLKIGENKLSNYDDVGLINLSGNVVQATTGDSEVGYEEHKQVSVERRIPPSGDGPTSRHAVSRGSVTSGDVAVNEGWLNMPKGSAIRISGLTRTQMETLGASFRTKRLPYVHSQDSGYTYGDYSVLDREWRVTVPDIIARINADGGTSHTSMAINATVFNYSGNQVTASALLRATASVVIHENVHTLPNVEVGNEGKVLVTEGEVFKVGLDVAGNLYSINDSGNIRSQSVSYRLEYRALGTRTWSNMTTLDSSGPNFTGNLSWSSTKVFRRSYCFDMPSLGRYEIKITRTSGDLSNDTRRHARLSWSLRSFRPDNVDYVGQSRFAMRVKASEQLHGTLDELNGVAKSRCADWDSATSTWVADIATSNPASLLRAFALGSKDSGDRVVWGCGLGESELDLDAIQRWHSFCKAWGLECNMVIDQQTTAAETLEVIARCGRASVSWQSGKLGVVWDAPFQPVVAVYSPENIIAGSFSVTYNPADEHDEIEANYVDRKQGWQQKSIRKNIPGREAVVRSRRMELFGMTDPEVVAEELELATNSVRHRLTKTITWEASVEGLVIGKGDVVQLSHDMTDWGVSGRCLPEVVSAGDPTEVSVLADKDIVEGHHALVYTGGQIHPAVCSAGRKLVFTGETLPAAGGDVAKDWHFVAGPQETPGFRVKVVSVVPLDQHKVRINAVPDPEGYYAIPKLVVRPSGPLPSIQPVGITFFTVALSRKPTKTIELMISVPESSPVRIIPNSIRVRHGQEGTSLTNAASTSITNYARSHALYSFTTKNWDTPQNVIVVAVGRIGTYSLRISPRSAELAAANPCLSAELSGSVAYSADWPHQNGFLQELPQDSTPVSSATELAAIQANRKYHLTADIDLTGRSWSSISRDDVVLDGRHHKIIGLTRPLFANRLQFLTVRNLQFVQARISGYQGIVADGVGTWLRTGQNPTGSLVLEQISTCPSCRVSDESQVSDGVRVGLFVGEIERSIASAKLKNVLGKGVVTATGSNQEGGGLVGISFTNATFDRCVAKQTMRYTQAPTRSRTRGAICYSDEYQASTYNNCHVDTRLDVPENPERISVGITYVHGNISTRYGPITQPTFNNCTYSPDVPNPVLEQGTVLTA